MVPKDSISDISEVVSLLAQKDKRNILGLAELLLIICTAEKNKDIVDAILSKMDNFKQLNPTQDLYEFVYTEQRISKAAFEYAIQTGSFMIIDYVFRACRDLAITLALSEFKLAEIIVNSYKNDDKELLLHLSEQDLLLEIDQDKESIKKLSMQIRNSYKPKTFNGNIKLIINARLDMAEENSDNQESHGDRLVSSNNEENKNMEHKSRNKHSSKDSQWDSGHSFDENTAPQTTKF